MVPFTRRRLLIRPRSSGHAPRRCHVLLRRVAHPLLRLRPIFPVLAAVFVLQFDSNDHFLLLWSFLAIFCLCIYRSFSSGSFGRYCYCFVLFYFSTVLSVFFWSELLRALVGRVAERLRDCVIKCSVLTSDCCNTLPERKLADIIIKSII